MRAGEILKEITEINLPSNKFYILGDAVLVLHGIKQETDEIELCISIRLFNTLRENKRINFLINEDKDFYNLDGKSNIRVITKYKKDFNCVKVGDLYLEDIRQIYKFKKKNKKKNKADVEGIGNFLQKYPNYPKF